MGVFQQVVRTSFFTSVLCAFFKLWNLSTLVSGVLGVARNQALLQVFLRHTLPTVVYSANISEAQVLFLTFVSLPVKVSATPALGACLDV